MQALSLFCVCVYSFRLHSSEEYSLFSCWLNFFFAINHMPENIQWSSIDIDSIPLLEKNWTKCIDEAEDNNDGWKTVVRCAHNGNTLRSVMQRSSVRIKL
jgi:hypothetical protein